MNLTLRPMHESEEPLVKSTWTGSIDRQPHSYTDHRGRRRDTFINGRMRKVGENHCPWVRAGADDVIVTWAFVDMHRAWVKAQWADLDIIVAAHPANDEAIGWCASTPPGDFPLVVHYVYVIDLESARRRGVATNLLRAALATGDHRPARFSHMNATGRHMVEAFYRSMPTRELVAKMRDGASMH